MLCKKIKMNEVKQIIFQQYYRNKILNSFKIHSTNGGYEDIHY